MSLLLMELSAFSNLIDNLKQKIKGRERISDEELTIVCLLIYNNSGHINSCIMGRMGR